LEPPAVHSTTNSDNKGIGSPSGPDSDLVVRKLGEKGCSEICPDDAEAPFNKTKEP
jgi:hypothetical protein